MCLQTCNIIPVEANEKGQYVSWLCNTTIVLKADYDFWKTGFFNFRAI